MIEVREVREAAGCWLYLSRTFLLSVLSCLLSSGTCCIYEVERISNGKRVSLGESSKSLSLYFLFPCLLPNPLRRYCIQKETGQRQVFPCSATEMKKTCNANLNSWYTIHKILNSNPRSELILMTIHAVARIGNEHRVAKTSRLGIMWKCHPFWHYPNPLGTTHYSLPSTPFLFLLILLGFRCATFTTCAPAFIHHKWQTRNFQLNFHFALASKIYIFHMSAAGCNYAINYSSWPAAKLDLKGT